MAHFPPTPVFPVGIDSDSTLFLVYNTAEATTTADNNAWADEIDIAPCQTGEQWASNGFANIGGELFYYDDVGSVDGKVVKLKRCLRNLGGSKTKFNPARTWVRGYVIAEHHNQLVDAILNLENYVGADGCLDDNSLDCKVQELEDLADCSDDNDCPDVSCDFTITSSDINATVAQYTINITGTYSRASIDFGDGSSSNLLSGTHTYAPNTTIDPIVTVTNTKCEVIESPSSRTSPDEPQSPTGGGGTFIPVIPTFPTFPTFSIPSVGVPRTTLTLPQIVFPCLDMGTLGPIVIPSVINIVPPIEIPSLIEFGPINIPSMIEFADIPNFPSIISFATPPDFPLVISFANPPDIPSVIGWGNVPSIPSIITFDCSDIWRWDGTQWVVISCPNISLIMGVFGTTEISGHIPITGCTEINGTISIYGGYTNTITPKGGINISIPVTGGFNTAITVRGGFMSSISPTGTISGIINVVGVPVSGIISIIGTATDTIPVYGILEQNVSVYGTVTGTVSVVGDVSSIVTPVGGVSKVYSVQNIPPVPSIISVLWGNGATLDIDWSGLTSLDLTVTVTVSCEGINLTDSSHLAMLSPDGTKNEPAIQNILGIPSEIKMMIPKMPDIKVTHNIPTTIQLEMPNIPSIKVLIPEGMFPDYIEVVNKQLPATISIDASGIPSVIKLDASTVPQAILLKGIEKIPTHILVDGSGIPKSIRVVGIPDSIEIRGNIPSEIGVVAPEDIAVPLVYNGGPIPVVFNTKVFSDKDMPCFAIVPCPQK